MTMEKKPGIGAEQSKELTEDTPVLKRIDTSTVKLHFLEEKWFTIHSVVLGDGNWMP